MGVKHSTLHDWYKNHLSGFNTSLEQGELHRYDIINQKRPEETIAVPIVKMANVGSSMAIDEKHIGGIFYTILSNNETGKIALMAATHRKKDLDEAMIHLGDKRFEVKILTRDLSPTYDWIGRTHFMNAAHVADKFHILRHVFDALHDVRIFYRQQLLTKKREEQKNRLKENKAEKNFKEATLENGDTRSELLARSIYLLYKKEADWSSSQCKRAKILFAYYPEIEKAYRLVLMFRDWYSKSQVGKELNQIKRQLYHWYDLAYESKIPELMNVKALLQRHEGVICNYFLSGQTNAKAEAINRTIQNIITSRINTRNMDFAHFRFKNILT